MKKLLIVSATTLAFAIAAFFSVYPINESNAQVTYTVWEFRVKPAFTNTICPQTGSTVLPIVRMDPSESGPCACPNYYDDYGLVEYQFRGFKCNM